MLKNLKKIEIISIIGILIVYFISRLISINNFPIFTDEAIYLRWAQIAKNDANWRFISLTDGKQPLFIWLTMISMRFITDPIIAGRFVSVIVGAFTIIGLILLGKIIFEKWGVGIIAGLIYTILPFALVYDRMALMDGLLGCAIIWALLFEIILVKTLRLDIALITGGIVGFGLLTKTSALFALYLLPFSLLLFDWRKPRRLRRLTIWVGLALVVIIISQMMYSILRLSPFFHIIGQKDQTFIYSISQWLTHPFKNIIGNLNGLINWFTIYLTKPIVITLLVSLLWGKKFIKEKLLLLLWFIIPFMALALFGFVLYPRFIFFMVIPLLVLIGYVINRLFGIRKLYGILLLVILFIMPLIIDLTLLVKPTEAQVPRSDSNQYFNDWPSGWGIEESIAFFKEKSKNNKIAIYTEGTFGLLPAAIELYLADNPNIYIRGIWPVPNKLPNEIVKMVSNRPTYIIFFQNPPPPAWSLEKVLEIQKGKSKRFNTVYQIKP
ncbi:MAG: glycosyltransferase family 39 protein [Candidatus Gottesmanbacteria bacterium]